MSFKPIFPTFCFGALFAFLGQSVSAEGVIIACDKNRTGPEKFEYSVGLDEGVQDFLGFLDLDIIKWEIDGESLRGFNKDGRIMIINKVTREVTFGAPMQKVECTWSN